MAASNTAPPASPTVDSFSPKTISASAAAQTGSSRFVKETVLGANQRKLALMAVWPSNCEIEGHRDDPAPCRNVVESGWRLVDRNCPRDQHDGRPRVRARHDGGGIDLPARVTHDDQVGGHCDAAAQR